MASAPLRIALLGCNRNARLVRRNPSFTYRCENLAEALQRAGHEVWLGHVSRFPWWRRFDLVQFHRPLDGPRLALLSTLLRARGTRLQADFDDLVFDPALAEASPAVVNGLRPLAAVRAEFARHAAALRRIGRASVSTAPLAEHAARLLRVPPAVVPNAVHGRWRALPPPAGPKPPLLTYLPGTRSHDRDFALIAPAIERVLARHPQLRLRVTGPLNFRLAARDGQVLHDDKLPFERFHEAVQRGRVNLAPLEATPFTRCKSALKVIEAGCFGIPTVISPLPDAERFADAGAVIADGAAAWEAALERLLFDDAAYAAATDGLAERVRARADIDRIAADWLAAAWESADAA